MNQYTFCEGEKKRLLLIDHRPILRKGFNLVLQQFESRFWIAEETRLFPGFKYLSQKHPDVIVAAIDGLSKLATFELLRQIKARFPEAKIILYTCELDVVIDSIVFSKGVDGYLSGNFGQDEFLECLSNVLAGRVFIIAAAIQSGGPEGKSYRKRVLSPRQMQIAGYLASGMSSSGIAMMLQKKVSTISTTKAAIFKKLRVSSVIELAKAIELEMY